MLAKRGFVPEDEQSFSPEDVERMRIASAFGVEETVLARAAHEASLAEKQGKNGCAAFRKRIPFDRISERMGEPDAWVYDEAILPFLVKTDSGYRTLREDKWEEAVAILDREYEEI